MNAPNARLELSPDEMRELGHRIVDMVVDHFTTLREQPVTGRATRRELESRLREPIPERGSDPAAVLARLEADVLPFMMHVDHPRFFAFVPGPSNFVGAMADALVTGLNVFQGTWLASSGPSQVELVTIDWLREMCGLPDGAGGLFVSGGSLANVQGLAVARHVRLGGDMQGATVYFSDQTHSAVGRGLKTLGFPEDAVRVIPSDARLRLDVRALREAIAADRSAGLRPFCVVANAGTTNAGAVDPLNDLADLCAAEDLWLHADGAYGAAAALSERGRQALAGLERVHSLALDPHKWMFQPFEIGCILVREDRWLRETFRVHPDYMRDTALREGDVNFAEHGVQLTRTFRALKLWMSLQVFGRESFAAAVERGFQLAEHAEAALRARDGWEIVTPANMATLTFRWAPRGLHDEEADRITSDLVEAVFADGGAMLSSTRIRGRTVLRICSINPRTTEADIEATVALLDRLARA